MRTLRKFVSLIAGGIGLVGCVFVAMGVTGAMEWQARLAGFGSEITTTHVGLGLVAVAAVLWLAAAVGAGMVRPMILVDSQVLPGSAGSQGLRLGSAAVGVIRSARTDISVTTGGGSNAQTITASLGPDDAVNAELLDAFRTFPSLDEAQRRSLESMIEEVRLGRTVRFDDVRRVMRIGPV